MNPHHPAKLEELGPFSIFSSRLPKMIKNTWRYKKAAEKKAHFLNSGQFYTDFF